jgi:hypothetical protein
MTMQLLAEIKMVKCTTEVKYLGVRVTVNKQEQKMGLGLLENAQHCTLTSSLSNVPLQMRQPNLPYPWSKLGRRELVQ